MKNLALISILFSIIGLFASCEKSTQIECIRVSSSIISETRDVKDYSEIIMNTIASLKITQGPEYSFKIEGPENVVELTTSQIQNDLLVIGTNTCFNGDYELTIDITAPTYEVLSLSGIGSIESTDIIEGNILEVEIIGIGIVDLEVLADTLYTTITGQANVLYSGSVHRHELESSGEFTFKGFPLITNHTVMDVSGIGDSEVTANESLRVFIEGTGNVSYKGSPLVDDNITGTGEIIDAN